MQLSKEQQKVFGIVKELVAKKNTALIRLSAAAGSGKTSTVINCVHQLKQQSSSNNVYVITFTKKSAEEIQQRLKQNSIGANFAGTMHSLAYRICIKAMGTIKLIRDSEKVKIAIVQQIFPEYLQVDLTSVSVDSFLSDEQLSIFHEKYHIYKQKRGLLDFDDLIKQATVILQKESTLEKIQLLIVDEFQDTSQLQLSFIKAINPKVLLIVGDVRQSIYQFRGAVPQNMHNIQKHYVKIYDLFLTHNFRSQANIIKIANKFLKKAKQKYGKKMQSTIKPQNKPIFFVSNEACSCEAKLQKYFSLNKFHELTILVRTNYVKNLVSVALKKLNIPETYIVMTVHAAKGLEFENVLIYGLESGIFPHRMGDINEEVRVFYVAITRAKYTLHFLGIEPSEKKLKKELFQQIIFNLCKIKILK